MSELDITGNKKKGKEKKNDYGKDVSEKIKRRSKSKKDVENLHGSSASTRKESRKRKHDGLDDAAIDAGVEETTNKEEKKHKKRKREDISVNSLQSGSHKEKPRSEEDFVNNEEDMEDGAKGTDAQAILKKKKRSRDKGTRKKSKKSHKEDNDASSIPDPHGDSTLSDKGRAALSYAYTRFSAPDSWKFNKAHQNWIVKHFFSFDAIPNIYVPIVVKYLAGCQGGVRQNLVQACKKRLETSGPNQNFHSVIAATTTSSDHPAVTDSNMAPQSSSGAHAVESHEESMQRARTLLAVLEDGTSQT